MMLFPWERSAEVMHAWRELTETLPDEMHASARIMQFPPIPDLPDFLRGRKLVVIEAVYLGDAATGDELMRPLVELGPEMNTLGTMPGAQLQALHMDPPQPVPGASDYMVLDDLTPEAVDTLIELAGPGSESPLLAVELKLLGGELSRPRDDHGARGTFPGRYMLFMVGMVMSPEAKAAILGHAGLVTAALADLRSDSGYLNFADAPGRDSAELFDAAAYARLREIKARYDGGGRFVSNHPIR
jgi:hypothetical protein